MIKLAENEVIISCWSNGRAHFAMTNLGNFWWYGSEEKYGYKYMWRLVEY